MTPRKKKRPETAAEWSLHAFPPSMRGTALHDAVVEVIRKAQAQAYERARRHARMQIGLSGYGCHECDGYRETEEGIDGMPNPYIREGEAA